MAYRRRYKKYGVRSKKNRKSRYGGRKWFKKRLRSSKTKQPQYAPDRYFTKLRYSEFVNVNDSLSGYGYTGARVIKGNSLYDPEDEFGGDQPYGFDQLAAMYNNYRVHACKVTAKVHGIGGALGGSIPPYYVGVFPYTIYDSLPTDVNWIGSVSERPYSKVVTRNAFDNSPSVKAVMSSAKIYGLSKASAKINSKLSADVGANPEDQWYFQIAYGQLRRDASESASYAMQIRVTYYCEFFGRKQLPRS